MERPHWGGVVSPSLGLCGHPAPPLRTLRFEPGSTILCSAIPCSAIPRSVIPAPPFPRSAISPLRRSVTS
ncbi:hypothetical protein CLOM_g5140 [Closterium sp. NIES-68]|nr:hypothetical protein CLOM_g5140 [Closterium sp. NIES-68]GJP79615.1 hypothetical protein CLOP_g9825 [Closterium sp. NIES-67]